MPCVWISQLFLIIASRFLFGLLPTGNLTPLAPLSRKTPWSRFSHVDWGDYERGPQLTLKLKT